MTTDTAPPQRARTRARPRRRTGRWVASALAVVILVLAVAAALVLLDARRAQASLESAAAKVGELRSQITTDGMEALDPAIASLQADAAAAVDDTTGPHWWIAAHTPVVGPSVRAVQTVAAVVDGLARDTIPALAEAVTVLDPAVLLPAGGRIDVQPLLDVAPAVVQADDAVQRSSDRLAAIDTDRVIGRVAGPVTELRGMVDELRLTTATASRAVQLLPPMLGSEGDRTYLMLAVNNSELRSLGGMVGAWLPITVSDGTITLGERFGAGTFNSSDPVLPLTDEELAIYTDRPARFGANPTMLPDFPRAAEIARAMWARTEGGEVDGVLAADPVALQHILGATGPVTVEGGTILDGSNASQVLLNQIYIDEQDPAKHDAFFGAAASAAFDRLLAGNFDVWAVLDALDRSADEGRLLVWSAHPEEEELLSGTVLSGELRGERGSTPIVGVYLNDASATKMGYYLDTAVTVTGEQCPAEDAPRKLTLVMDITSTAPLESADFPSYLSGVGLFTPGSVVTNVLVYSPAGGTIEGVTVDGARTGGTRYFTHDGMEVAGIGVELKPGQSQRLEIGVTTAPGQRSPAEVRMTPTSLGSVITVTDPACDLGRKPVAVSPRNRYGGRVFTVEQGKEST